MQLDHVLKSVYDMKGLSLETENGAGWRFDEVCQVRVFVCVEPD
jgi:hypothetical protein